MSFVACKNKDKDESRQIPVVRVETLTVSETNVNASRVYSGVIEETSGTAVSFSVPGTISSIAVSEGQQVAKGQLIATLDAYTLQNNLEIAKAALATAQDTYDRMKLLHDSNSIPEMRWVEVSNALKAAQSSYNIAKNALGDAQLHAPISGVISQKIANIGEIAAPGLPVVKIAQISPVKASISVSENDIDKFAKGAEANVYIDISGGISLKGVLVDKGITSDPLSRTYTVKFRCDNPEGKILPGMLCNVSLISGGETEGIVIPVNAILLDNNNQSFVWTVKDGKAHKSTVTLGEYAGTGVLISSGLEPGDSVIVSGQQKVSDGMNVDVI